MIRAAFALLWLAALLLPTAARADERILSYHSDVAVQPDSSLLVAETITVRAEGIEIRRGIYRDFPTRYKGSRGGRVRVGFELLDVTRNGAPEPATTESIGNGVRIRIGQEDVFLTPGDYRYVIRYRTTRQLGRFEDFDELYWNVTGNGWMFPIDQAEARITLPSPAGFGQRAVYTGPQGATGQQAEVVSEELGEIVFRTTAPLAPYEGLTVAVAWPKGVVAEPSAGERRKYWLADFGPLIAGGLSLFGILAFYWTAWRRAGRDPPEGTVVPIFSPPDDLSPAAMRYIWKMKTDNRAFAAALVDLGVKGQVRLVEEEGGWFSSDKTRIERLAASGPPLPAAEGAMVHALAEPGDSIAMEKGNHAKFIAARNALDADFKKRFEGKLFHRNWWWAGVGVAVLVAAIWLAAMISALATGAGSTTSILVSLGATAAAALLVVFGKGLTTLRNCLIMVMAAVLVMLALATGFPVLAGAVSTDFLLPILLPMLALPVVMSAFWWISAPTKEGRAVLDRIAGFRQYLSIAERERLDRMTAPKDTPEIFERYLPYAIALGVENDWADRFRSVLAAASVQGQQQGFAWYSGSRDPWNDSGSFVDDVGSSLASSVSSASTAPGSSSGSGGGGSSGGGGGGGGGGGW